MVRTVERAKNRVAELAERFWLGGVFPVVLMLFPFRALAGVAVLEELIALPTIIFADFFLTGGTFPVWGIPQRLYLGLVKQRHFAAPNFADSTVESLPLDRSLPTFGLLPGR